MPKPLSTRSRSRGKREATLSRRSHAKSTGLVNMPSRKDPNVSGLLSNLPQQVEIPEDVRWELEQDAPIVDDYIRQWVGELTRPGVISSRSAVTMNTFDHVMQTVSYQGLSQYDLYDEVEKDPRVIAVYASIADAMTRLPWYVTPPASYEDDPRAQEIASFVQNVIAGIEGWTQDVREFNDCIGKGFCTGEIMWKVRPHDGATVIAKILNRPQRRIQFDPMTSWPKIRNASNAFYGDPVPPHKFIVHKAKTRYESPFGIALDETVFYPFLQKRLIIKFFLTFLEVGAAGVPIVEVPAGASKELKSAAKAFAKALRSSGYGYRTDNMKLDWGKQAEVGGTAQAFIEGIRLCNEEITNAALGQTLTTEASGSRGSGSKALGAVHQDILWDRIVFYASAEAQTFTDTICRWIVDENFDKAEEYYPTFTFDTSEPTDMVMITAAIDNLAKAGWKVKTPDYIEDVTGIPVEYVGVPQPNTAESQPQDQTVTKN